MCDEFESGFDSFDDVSDSFDDVSVDDLSSTMDEVSVMDDDMGAFEDFEDVSESVTDDSVMDLMDETEVVIDESIFEDDMTQYEDIGGLDSEDIDETSFDIQDDTLLDESDYIEDIQEDTLLNEADVSDELIIDSSNTLDTGIEDESNDDTLIENVESEVSTEDVQEHLNEDDTQSVEQNESIDNLDEMDLSASQEETQTLEDEDEFAEESEVSQNDSENFSEEYESSENIQDDNETTDIVENEPENTDENFEEVIGIEETESSVYGEAEEFTTDESDFAQIESSTGEDISSEIETETNDIEEDSIEVNPETSDEIENADSLDDSDFMPDEIETIGSVEEHAPETTSELDSSEETITLDEMSENSALDNMTEYMAEHNYGLDDFETYSQDPEWQQLNNELLESDGREPIDYSENVETSAMDSMTEYMYEHNYGRDDFETYSQDPEWQQLNNDLLQEMGREPIDYSENVETSAMDSMTEYMYEHNYGRDDFETYSQDPEWQQLNNDLLQEMGREPIDYSENVETSTMDSMTEYMYEHNYGLDDFETYSQDPEWQQLNNDLLQEMGREPIDYGETGETFIEDTGYNDIPESEQSILDIMDNVEVDDMESLDDALDNDLAKPDFSVEEWMNDVSDPTLDEAFELDDVVENPTVVEELENVEAPYDIEHNVEFAESLLEDRPELAEMFRNGEFFEQGNNEHGFEGTCGETTQANTLNKLLGTNEITENDVLNIAIDKNLCEVDVLDPANSGGTSTEQFMQLYDEMNHRVGDKLNIELFDYDDALGIDDMASRIENGSVLNIAVDSYELWDQPRDITDTAHYTDHWISVTGVDRRVDGGIIGFKIVDSGGGESYLDIDKFERCYYGAKDSPVIDPTCIVVSRKGK